MDWIKRTKDKLITNIFSFVSEIIHTCIFFLHWFESFLIAGQFDRAFAANRRIECMRPDLGDVWDLNTSTLRFMLPRLKLLKKIHHGYPPSITEEEWEDILGEMIISIEVLIQDYPKETLEDYDTYARYTDNTFRTYDHLLHLLKKYFEYLWD